MGGRIFRNQATTGRGNVGWGVPFCNKDKRQGKKQQGWGKGVVKNRKKRQKGAVEEGGVA